MTIKFPTIPSFIFDVCIPSCTSVVQTTQNADSDCSTIPSMAAITIDEDYGNESNNEDAAEVKRSSKSKKAKTWHLHTFCDSWLKVPELRGWLSLAKRDGVKQAVCTVCNDHFKHPNEYFRR